MFLLPLLPLAVRPVYLGRAQHIGTVTAPAQFSVGQQGLPQPTFLGAPAPAPPAQPAVNWNLLMSSIWLAVAFAGLARLAYGVRAAGRVTDEAETIRDDRVRRLQEQIAATLEMAAPYPTIFESEAVTVPLAVGAANGCVLLPPGWREWDDEKLRAVLAHELAHLRRGDWNVRLWSLVARSVFWFHPLAWWLERRLNTLAEICCDEEGALAVGDAARYAEVLLGFARVAAPLRGQFVLAGMAMARPGERNGVMQQRLERILHNARPGRGVLGGPALATLVLLALPVLWAAAALHAGQAPPRPAAQIEYNSRPGFPDRVAKRPHPDEDASLLTMSDVERLEQAVSADPANDTARGKLIAYYYLHADAENWRRHVFWVIANRPASELCIRKTFVARPGQTPFASQADMERAQSLWQSQVTAHPADARVLLNAAICFERIDPSQALRWLVQANEADRTDRAVFAELLAMLTYLRPVIVRGATEVTPQEPPFEPYSTDVLDASTDAELLGLVGEWESGFANYRSGSQQQVESLRSCDETFKSGMRDQILMVKPQAEKHLEHALALDPGNVRWQVALARSQRFDMNDYIAFFAKTEKPAEVPLPPPSGAIKRITVGGNVQQAMLIQQEAPVYPPLAKQARIQGVVRFTVLIEPDGSVSKADLIAGHPLLVQAATDAVRQWRYKPTLLNGEPVQVVTQVDVNFNLPEGQALSAPKRITISGNTKLAMLMQQAAPVYPPLAEQVRIRMEAPVYPPLAKQARIQGVVRFTVVIEPDGSVSKVDLVAGHPLLVQAATDAVRQARYTPVHLNGEAVQAVAQVEVNFTLPEGQAK